MAAFKDVATTLHQATKRAIGQASVNPRIQTALAWCGVENGATFEQATANVPLDGRVLIYFGDEPEKLYQLVQWLPIIERLHLDHPVVLLFRRVESFRAAAKYTTLPRTFVRRFTTLMDVYEQNVFELILYVNNSRSNFQSLEHPRPVHVHINHGESDKLSMVSNKAKAYDFVFVAGPAAVARHKARLIGFDLGKLVVTGRPQLDVDFAPTLPTVPQRSVMYAPTWEGENEENNYTSIDVYGIAIVRSLLNLPGIRVLYKPHPRVADSKDPEVLAAHREICRSIEDAGGDHQVLVGGNILSMFSDVDGLVTDISSVGLDFLYLHPEKPLILTDRRNDRGRLAVEAPISRSCAVVERANLTMLKDLLESWLFEDDARKIRLVARESYFGDLERGASTERFLGQISQLIRDRKERLKDYRAWHPTAESQ